MWPDFTRTEYPQEGDRGIVFGSHSLAVLLIQSGNVIDKTLIRERLRQVGCFFGNRDDVLLLDDRRLVRFGRILFGIGLSNCQSGQNR